MPFIKWIEDDEATGQLAEVYAKWKEANPGRKGIPEILKCFSLRPDVLAALNTLAYPLHFADGNLTRRTKEMLATYVSALNQCPY